MKRLYLLVLLISAVLCSCSTPKDITYMQNFENGQTRYVAAPNRLTVRPGDKLSIVVTCADPELAEVFNLAVANYRIGSATAMKAGSYSSESKVGSFTVDPNGSIEYPLIGSIYVSGLTREQIAREIKEKIIASKYIVDPTVTVDFLNASVSVLGDVKNPGSYIIDRDDMTIIQAISLAGDLNITGRRDNVLVVRREGDTNKAYRVDLTNAEELMQSPVFYVQQNDAIYIDPNDTKKRQATAWGNTVLTPGFWISIVSVMCTIAVVIFK